MDAGANPLIDREVEGAVPFWECLQWSHRPHLLNVVGCGVM